LIAHDGAALSCCLGDRAGPWPPRGRNGGARSATGRDPKKSSAPHASSVISRPRNRSKRFQRCHIFHAIDVASALETSSSLPSAEVAASGKSSNRYRPAKAETEIGLSVVTVAELVHGAYRAQTHAQQERRLEFVERLCRDLPAHPVTLDIARIVGRIEGQQEAKGIQFAFEDLVIGVTALHLGYAV
jgi:predicted nucleic acid-binding protein